MLPTLSMQWHKFFNTTGHVKLAKGRLITLQVCTTSVHLNKIRIPRFFPEQVFAIFGPCGWKYRGQDRWIRWERRKEGHIFRNCLTIKRRKDYFVLSSWNCVTNYSTYIFEGLKRNWFISIAKPCIQVANICRQKIANVGNISCLRQQQRHINSYGMRLSFVLPKSKKSFNILVRESWKNRKHIV